MHTLPLRMACSSKPVRFLVLLVVTALIFSQPVEASARKARGLYDKGRKAELAKDYDAAVEFFEQASIEAPKDHRYDLAVRRMRFVAGQTHVDVGHRLQEQGQLEEALEEFQRALEIDPASGVASQEHQRTLKLLEDRDKSNDDGESFDVESAGSPLEADRLQRSQRVKSLMQPAELAPLSTELIDIMLTENSKVVYETIGKLAGINVLFDPEFSDEEIEIEIKNATLQEALNYVGLMAGAFWKPITHNAVFIADDNTNKRRDFEEEVVKTIYLTNVATPQELQEITTAIRGLTDIRRMFPVNSMSAIILRGSRAKVALAEKVMHDVDKPRPEVIIDVLVLETSKSNNRTLGITPVSGGANGLQFPGTFTGIGSGGADGAASASVPLNRLRDIASGSWATTLPGFQVSALFNSSDTKLLQSPRIRAADNYKADLRIGDRIPIATGSFQPGVGGVGINPLVNTQFSYTDVGVNIALTPKIHSNREVSMHVEIEISNVRDFVDIGGISQPVIGQRTIQHDVRIREGEANVIGGLHQSQLFKTKSGVPFLGEIPIIGRLFSSDEVQRSESEILIVLIPHIVRMPGIDASNLRAVASGTDQVFQVRYEPKANGKSALPDLANFDEGTADEPEDTPEPAAVATAVEPSTTTVDEPQPAEATTVEPAAQAVVEAAPAAAPTAPAPAAAPAVASGSGLRLSLNPAAPTVAVGAELTVTLSVNDAVQLFSLPMRVQFDREFLELANISKGRFLEGDDASDVIFSRTIRQSNGLAAINISRFPGTGGADGSGALISLTFKGVAPGQAKLRFVPTGPRNADTEVLEISPLAVDFRVE